MKIEYGLLSIEKLSNSIHLYLEIWFSNRKF